MTSPVTTERYAEISSHSSSVHSEGGDGLEGYKSRTQHTRTVNDGVSSSKGCRLCLCATQTSIHTERELRDTHPPFCACGDKTTKLQLTIVVVSDSPKLSIWPLRWYLQRAARDPSLSLPHPRYYDVSSFLPLCPLCSGEARCLGGACTRQRRAPVCDAPKPPPTYTTRAATRYCCSTQAHEAKYHGDRGWQPT